MVDKKTCWSLVMLGFLALGAIGTLPEIALACDNPGCVGGREVQGEVAPCNSPDCGGNRTVQGEVVPCNHPDCEF